MRILGIDFGTKRIGLAITDHSCRLASPLAVVFAAKSLTETVDRLLEKIAPYQKEIAKIVVGMPYLKDGSKGTTAGLIEKFIAALQKKISTPIETIDESLTSFAAEENLKHLELSTHKKTGKLDSVAAAIILQDYLEAQC